MQHRKSALFEEWRSLEGFYRDLGKVLEVMHPGGSLSMQLEEEGREVVGHFSSIAACSLEYNIILLHCFAENHQHCPWNL